MCFHQALAVCFVWTGLNTSMFHDVCEKHFPLKCSNLFQVIFSRSSDYKWTLRWFDALSGVPLTSVCSSNDILRFWWFWCRSGVHSLLLVVSQQTDSVHVKTPPVKVLQAEVWTVRYNNTYCIRWVLPPDRTITCESNSFCSGEKTGWEICSWFCRWGPITLWAQTFR